MIANVQVLLFLVLSLILLGIELWALLDAARRPAGAFTYAGKRTKRFWVLLTGAGALVGFIAIPPPLGLGIFGTFAMFVAVVPAGVYLADVRPEVRSYGGGRRGPQGGGW
ncbi:DUF2516 family protein [Georgenia sp. SUBG003]|uniref:DUF2516 family protein n=1 Tax=Georgenia sp. SUBG003 TaxID=1497974 RepID=UPI0004DAC6FC|nr:hypothetical protein DA06_11690 [Georgenia sp. SUBG003]